MRWRPHPWQQELQVWMRPFWVIFPGPPSGRNKIVIDMLLNMASAVQTEHAKRDRTGPQDTHVSLYPCMYERHSCLWIWLRGYHFEWSPPPTPPPKTLWHCLLWFYYDFCVDFAFYYNPMPNIPSIANMNIHCCRLLLFVLLLAGGWWNSAKIRKPQTQNALRSTEKTIKIRPKTIPNDP